MNSPPTAEGMEPLSSLVLRLEDPRREERCFYCHRCSAPFSTGDTLSDDVQCPRCSETFVEELFDDQSSTPVSGGGGEEGRFLLSPPLGGTDEGQSRRVHAQQEVRFPTQFQEEGLPFVPPSTDSSSSGEGVGQAVAVGGAGSGPSDEGTDSGRQEVMDAERMETQERETEREAERQRERDREWERTMEEAMARQRESDMERELAGVRGPRPYRGGYIRATFTRPGADTDRDSDRDRDPFDDDPFLSERDRMRRSRMRRDRFGDRDRDLERDRNGRPRMVIRMTTHGGAQMTIVADTSAEGEEPEELGLSRENAARLQRENSGMLQLMHTLITSFGRTEADLERERQQRQQEEEEWDRMPPEEQARRQELDEMIRLHAGIPPWVGRRPYMRRSQAPVAGDPRNYAWGARGLDDIITWLQSTMGDGGGSPPADKDKVEQLPKRSVSEQEASQQCSICQEVYVVSEELVFLPCSHYYHACCILPWLDLHDTCPTCRYSINKGVVPPEHPPPTTASGASGEESAQQSSSSVQGTDYSSSSSSSTGPSEEPTSVFDSSVNPESGTGNESV